jgi:MFS family permease
VVVAGTLLVLRATPGQRTTSEPTQSGRKQIVEGLIFVRENPWLWRTLLAAGLALLAFAGPSQVLLPFLVKNQLHAGAGAFGAIRAAGGIGAICAAIIVGHTGRPGPILSAMFIGWALQCLALAGYAIVTGAWVFATISFLSGAMGAVANIVWSTLIKARVPNHLLGRVSSVDWFVSIGLVPLSYALTGPIAQAAGTRTTMILAGVIASGTILAFVALPGTRGPAALQTAG